MLQQQPWFALRSKCFQCRGTNEKALRPLRHSRGVRESPSQSPAPTHTILGVAVAGADDGSCLLDHLQDDSPVDIPSEVGIIRSHDPARGETWELTPCCRAPDQGQPPIGIATALPDELLGHLTMPMPATSPALPARGFLRAAAETALNCCWDWKEASLLCRGQPARPGQQHPSSSSFCQHQIIKQRRKGETR